MKKKEIIVDGYRYTIENNDPRWKGFGGRRFTVKFHDGEIVKTDDLWWDFHFKTDSLPDTATLYEGWNLNDDSKPAFWKESNGIRYLETSGVL